MMGMALSESTVRFARANGKDYTLKDTDGLALSVNAKGSKSWHFRFYWGGSQERISLGPYPEIGLKEARARRDDARALVAQRIDPRAHRRRERAVARAAGANTFEGVFHSWRDFTALSLETGRQSTLSQINRIFAKDILPTLGERSIFDIARTDLLEPLRKFERRGALTTAEKCRTWLNQLFRYAMVEVNLAANPAADLDIVAMPQPPVTHNPFLRMSELLAFLRKLRNCGGDIRTQWGLRLLLLTGVRTGELRSAVPEQFDLECGLWIIPPAAVKQLQQRLRREDKDIPPYVVPLCRQAIAIVRQLLAAKPPGQRYLFPHRSEPTERMSENTLNGALRRLGYQDRLTGHGIRATISTALNEIGYNTQWIDAQLSHADASQVRKAYNHAQYVEQRRRMMQDWADRIDQWESQGEQEAPGLSESVQMIVPQASPSSDDSTVQGGADNVDAATCEVATVPGATPSTPAPMMIASRSDQRPQPAQTDIQRERAKMLATFEAPHNLPLPVFAKLAGKSRHQINREIRSRRLLSLNMGNRGQRIPDWQLDPVRLQFIHTVLERTEGVDGWTLYRVLSEPLDGLDGCSPVDAIAIGNLPGATSGVFRALGLN
jgi:integrase